MNLNPRKMIDLMFRKRCVEIGLKKEGNLVSSERRRLYQYGHNGRSSRCICSNDAQETLPYAFHTANHSHSVPYVPGSCKVFSKFDPTDNWFLCEAKKESQRLLTRCAETRTWDLGLRRIQLHLHENSSSRKQADGDRKFNEINQS